jgi:hypothetical protein
MAKLFPHPLRHRTRLTLVLLSLCFCLGWGLAQGLQPSIAQSIGQTSKPDTVNAIGTVDPVAVSQQRGQDLYLATCASCHIAIPPAVLPSQTWLALLQDQEHYGTQVPTISSFNRRLIWNYLKTYSRSLRVDEAVPYRLASARHFYALHPQVDLPRNVTIDSCISCHPKANVFNFREWQLENLRSSTPASPF